MKRNDQDEILDWESIKNSKRAKHRGFKQRCVFILNTRNGSGSIACAAIVINESCNDISVFTIVYHHVMPRFVRSLKANLTLLLSRI